MNAAEQRPTAGAAESNTGCWLDLVRALLSQKQLGNFYTSGLVSEL